MAENKTLMTQIGEFLADYLAKLKTSLNAYADNAAQDAATTQAQLAKSQAVQLVADDLREYSKGGPVGQAFVAALMDEAAYSIAAQLQDYLDFDITDRGGQALYEQLAAAIAKAIADNASDAHSAAAAAGADKTLADTADPSSKLYRRILEIANNRASELIGDAIADLVNSAPQTLDTLGEIATMLQTHDDALAAINAAVAEHDHQDATTDQHGFLSTSDKARIDKLGSFQSLVQAYNSALTDQQNSFWFDDQSLYDNSASDAANIGTFIADKLNRLGQFLDLQNATGSSSTSGTDSGSSSGTDSGSSSDSDSGSETTSGATATPSATRFLFLVPASLISKEPAYFPISVYDPDLGDWSGTSCTTFGSTITAVNSNGQLIQLDTPCRDAWLYSSDSAQAKFIEKMDNGELYGVPVRLAHEINTSYYSIYIGEEDIPETMEVLSETVFQYADHQAHYIVLPE